MTVVPKYVKIAYFSSEVLKDCSTVHSCRGSYTTVTGCASLQVPVDTTHWELAGNGHKKVKLSKSKGQIHHDRSL